MRYLSYSMSTGPVHQDSPREIRSRVIVGLRLRLALLFLGCVSLLLAFVALVWFPRLEARSELRVRQAVQEHLVTLTEAVKPFVLQKDLGAIHELLPATLDANPGWLAFKLTDDRGRRLYPLLDVLPQSFPKGHWIISRPIQLRGEVLGNLELMTDFSDELRDESRQNLLLAGVLMSVFVLWSLVVFWFFEQFVRSPIRRLAHAANRLAAGDYASRLPRVRGDEVGELVDDFAKMRDNLHRQREEILAVRDQLEQRVLQRTSELENANQALRKESTERLRVEERLRNSQKMEALGKLTGGVAHDFNNLMAVIGGHAELLRERFGESSSLVAIERASVRAARLTQQLLSFSRQQHLHPESIALSKMLEGLENLYQRTLGEKVTVVTRCGPEVWPILADAGQLDNALLNMAINARDAMPRGGTLSINCSNLVLTHPRQRLGESSMPAGDYVRIDVSDTGVGIPAELHAQVFEPFYTTKEVGKGSGLGLSMVYGFVRQSGGDVELRSEPGVGTTVSLLLPRAPAETADPAATIVSKPGKLPRGERRRILVIEDEPDVLSFIVDVLSDLDYVVFSAADATQAADCIATNAPIDLILSDVVLPGGVNGPEFVEGLRSRNPEIPVVFMTGYAPDASLLLVDGGPGFQLLRKPFSRAQLAAALQQAHVSQ